MPTAALTSPVRPLRHLLATRYVTALREGGSVPAVVEADDGALYVAKFRAAAQGGRALAAELIVGELARAAGLRSRSWRSSRSTPRSAAASRTRRSRSC